MLSLVGCDTIRMRFRRRLDNTPNLPVGEYKTFALVSRQICDTIPIVSLACTQPALQIGSRVDKGAVFVAGELTPRFLIQSRSPVPQLDPQNARHSTMSSRPRSSSTRSNISDISRPTASPSIHPRQDLRVPEEYVCLGFSYRDRRMK